MSLIVPARFIGQPRHVAGQPRPDPEAAIDGGKPDFFSDLFWTRASVERQLRNLRIFPWPNQYKVAVLRIDPEDQIGNVLVDDATVEKRAYGSATGVVLALGPIAFRDKERFPQGPTFGVGDLVLMPQYGGHTCNLPGHDGAKQAVVYLNDEEITGCWGLRLQLPGEAEDTRTRPPAEPVARGTTLHG